MWNYFLHCVRNKQKDTLLSFRSIRLAANHYQLANRRTLYDFLRQSLKLKNNSKNFRDFEKCELAYKIHFRQFPRYFSHFGEIWKPNKLRSVVSSLIHCYVISWRIFHL